MFQYSHAKEGRFISPAMSPLALPLLLLAFLLPAVLCMTSENHTHNDAQWTAAVENILSNMVLGPLKPEFTPAFLGQRTRETIITAQTNWFRAHVARILMTTLAPDGVVHIVPGPEISREVVRTQVDELKAHSFTVRWFGTGTNAFIVEVPKLKEK